MYKFHPHYSFLWRTPTSVQIGAENALVILEDVTPPEERLLSALLAGVSEPTLNAIAKDAGLRPLARQELLEKLSPVLIGTASAPQATRMRIALDGTGELVNTLSRTLVGQQHSVVMGSAAVSGRCDLAIIVAGHELEPHRAGAWLRRDTPHLPVWFGDRKIHIGPVAGTGSPTAACIHCVQLHRVEENPLWPTLATQLIHRPSASQTFVTCAEITSLLARWLENPGSHALGPNQALELDSQTGELREITYALHPDCACQALPRNVSVLVPRTDPSPAGPRTDSISSGHG